MGKPHTCPVCNGKGTVPWWFYKSDMGSISSIASSEEIYKSCGGKGYIIV